jgi:hypothetical protein
VITAVGALYDPFDINRVPIWSVQQIREIQSRGFEVLQLIYDPDSIDPGAWVRVLDKETIDSIYISKLWMNTPLRVFEGY